MAASLIDGLVLAPFTAMSFYAILSLKSLPLVLLASLPGLIYKPLMEWRYGATLGKMACGIRVIDHHGNRLSLFSAYIRFLPLLAHAAVGLLGTVSLFAIPKFRTVSTSAGLANLVTNSPWYSLSRILDWIIILDCLAVVFNRRKEAIHDVMAGSYCVKDRRSVGHSRPSPVVEFQSFGDLATATAPEGSERGTQQSTQSNAMSGPFDFATPKAVKLLKPHRGSTILVLGVLSLVLFPPLGIAAWVMGGGDLEAMRKQRMDRSGEGITQAGQVLGLVGALVWIGGFCAFVLVSMLSSR